MIRESFSILHGRFTTDDGVEGYREDGLVAVAKFEIGELDEPELREARVLRSREVSDLITCLSALIK